MTFRRAFFSILKKSRERVSFTLANKGLGLPLEMEMMVTQRPTRWVEYLCAAQTDVTEIELGQKFLNFQHFENLQ